MRTFLPICEIPAYQFSAQLRFLVFVYQHLELLINYFRYDADEVTTKVATPPRKEPLSEHKETLAPVTNTFVPSETKIEAFSDKEMKDTENDKHAYADELNGQGGQDGATAWNDAQVNEDRVNTYNDVSTEEESRGVGIKEDG